MPLFEFEEGTSRKFYRIELVHNRIELHWGRFGSDGKRQTIELADSDGARFEYERRLEARREKGYRQVVDESVPRAGEVKVAAPLSKQPRFQFVHAKKKRFRWLECKGASLLVAEGPLGREASVQPDVEPRKSVSDAMARRDALMAEMLETGWVLDGVAAKKAPAKRVIAKQLQVNDAFENAVAEKPDDESRWLVLEDWLLENADPRSTLITLEKTRARADAAEARGKMLPVLLGANSGVILSAMSVPVWRSGFLRSCVFSLERSVDVMAFTEFTKTPAASLLAELTLRSSSDPESHQRCIQLLETAPFSRSLRVLEITGGSGLLDASMLAGLRRLESLSLWQLRFTPWSALAHLRSLTLSVGDEEEVNALCETPWPALEHLELTVLAKTSATRVISSGAFPSLRSLRVHGPSDATPWLEALKLSPALGRLRRLELGTVPIEPRRLMGRYGTAFNHLEKLYLPER